MAEQITLSQVAALAAQLPPEERRQLAETLLQDLAAGIQPNAPSPRRFWREILGSVPYPLCGEDAQAWVSRTRRESDKVSQADLLADMQRGSFVPPPGTPDSVELLREDRKR